MIMSGFEPQKWGDDGQITQEYWDFLKKQEYFERECDRLFDEARENAEFEALMEVENGYKKME